MTPELALRRNIQVAASRLGCRLFRNNVGVGWAGTVIRRTEDAITLRNPRPLHAGLCVGSSDLIGWTANGKFLAIEVKTGRVAVTKDQRRFIVAVRKAGGLSGIARSVADAMAIMRGEVRD